MEGGARGSPPPASSVSRAPLLALSPVLEPLSSLREGVELARPVPEQQRMVIQVQTVPESNEPWGKLQGVQSAPLSRLQLVYHINCRGIWNGMEKR